MSVCKQFHMALFSPALKNLYSVFPSAFIRHCSVAAEPWKKLNFSDKVAVITGGASGIGYAIAKQFLTHGMMAVSLVDIDTPNLDNSAKLLGDEFGESRVIQYEADVSDTEQMDNAFRNTSMYYQTIDIIVNNAGILDDTNWEKQLNVNMRGCVIGTLLGMQYMAKSSSGEGGIIVNVGSVMGIMPSCGFPIHTMTQFGIAGFTRALGSSKLYQRTGVKVFGYCPGLTETNYLKDLSDKAINFNFYGEFQNEIENCTKQTPDNVAKGLAYILDIAKPGSLWVAEDNGLPYEVHYHGGLKKKKSETEEGAGVIPNAEEQAN